MQRAPHKARLLRVLLYTRTNAVKSFRTLSREVRMVLGFLAAPNVVIATSGAFVLHPTMSLSRRARHTRPFSLPAPGRGPTSRPFGLCRGFGGHSAQVSETRCRKGTGSVCPAAGVSNARGEPPARLLVKHAPRGVFAREPGTERSSLGEENLCLLYFITIF